MKRPLRFALAALVLALGHLLLHLGFGFGAEAPDLMTVGLLLLVREVRVGVAAGSGFLFGLLEDAFSLLSFGANTLAMTLVGIFGSITRDLFVGDSLAFTLGYLALGKWLRDAIHWGLTAPELREPFARSLLLISPLSALYVATLGACVWMLVGGSGRESS